MSITGFSFDDMEKRIAELEQEVEDLKSKLNFHERFSEFSATWDTFRDHHGKLIYVSPAFQTITGYEPGEYLKGKINFINIVHPEDRMGAVVYYQKQLEKQSFANFVCRILTKDKILKYVSVSSKPVYNQNNEYIGFRTSCIDVTGTKLIEISQKESEDKYRQLSEFSIRLIDISDIKDIYEYIINYLEKCFPNAIILFNSIDEFQSRAKLENIAGINNSILVKILKIARFNPVGRYYRLIPSYTEKFKTGKLVEFQGGLAEFSASEFPLVIARIIEKMLGIHKIYTVGIKRNENLLASIHFLTINKTEIHDFQFIESLVRQAGIVIQKKIAEQNLIQSENNYSQFLNSLKDFIWIINDSWKIIYCNEYILEKLGYSKAELLTHELHQIYAVDQKSEIQNLIFQAEKEKIESFQVPLVTKNGTQIPAETQVIRGLWNGKEAIYGICKDISELMLANQRLKGLNTTKDKLFTIISHDLRSPFNTILGYTELLKKNIREYDIEKTENFLNSISISANTTLNLLENLLSWAKTQTGQIHFRPKKILLKEVVQQSIIETGSTSRIKNVLIEDHTPSDIYVLADPNMVNVVLRNFLSNAIKFSHTETKIELFAYKKTPWIEVVVKDYGTGIPKDILEKIFDNENLFSRPGTAKEHGAGLGLLICKEFVEKHQGTIKIDSIEGKGSEFKFTLPES